MFSEQQRATHRRWLMEVTAIPTAAGREDRVIAWIGKWLHRRKDLRLRTDKAGNLIITQIRGGDGRPVFVTAHLDHPAFVVRQRRGRMLDLEFRGGVHPPYFDNAAIQVFDADDRPHRATIRTLDVKAKPFKRVTAELSKANSSIGAGDIGRWTFRGRGATPTVVDGILHTPACDDLAAVAAALATLDVLRRRKNMGHVGVLLTRAEEVGFIGAIAACRQRSVAKKARLICLENSRSFPDSPIGAGPILRVGDRLSVFDPALTNRLGDILIEHQKKNPHFTWQRKLMPGGACEATAFSTYGYESTCVCLPLGNYHNMADIDGVLAGRRPAKVAPEYIAVDDYHGMIELLAVCITGLDSAKVPLLEDRMNTLLAQNGHVLEPI